MTKKAFPTRFGQEVTRIGDLSLAFRDAVRELDTDMRDHNVDNALREAIIGRGRFHDVSGGEDFSNKHGQQLSNRKAEAGQPREWQGFYDIMPDLHQPLMGAGRKLIHELAEAGFKVRLQNGETLPVDKLDVDLNALGMLVAKRDISTDGGKLAFKKSDCVMLGRLPMFNLGGPLFLVESDKQAALSRESVSKLLWVRTAANTGINRHAVSPKYMFLMYPGYGRTQRIGDAFGELASELENTHGFDPSPLLIRLINESKQRIENKLPALRRNLARLEKTGYHMPDMIRAQLNEALDYYGLSLESAQVINAR